MSNARGENTKPRIEELESVRGLAALLVVFYHLPIWHPIFNFALSRNGYLMVDLFFCLSGFVICNAYSDRIKSLKDLIHFQFLRFGRLYPIHVILLLVFLVIELAKYLVLQKFHMQSQGSLPFVDNNAMAFVQQVFLLQAVGPTGNATTFNGPAWSISVEFYTYLFFAFIVLCVPRFKTAAFFGVFIVSLVALYSGTTVGFEHILRCFCGFFLGCVIACQTRSLQKAFLHNLVPFAAMFSMLLFLAIKPEKEFDLLIHLFSGALVLSLLVSADGLMKKFLRLRLLTWLGAISYSMYMIHFFLIWTFNQVARFVLQKPEVIVRGQLVPQLSILETVMMYALLLLLIFALSASTHRYIEVPLREWSRKLAATWRAQA